VLSFSASAAACFLSGVPATVCSREGSDGEEAAFLGGVVEVETEADRRGLVNVFGVVVAFVVGGDSGIDVGTSLSTPNAG